MKDHNRLYTLSELKKEIKYALKHETPWWLVWVLMNQIYRAGAFAPEKDGTR